MYSYFVYNISHPNKVGTPLFDLNSDSEAEVEVSELSLSVNQLAVERVITKVFTHYHCDVVITDRLRSMFTSKLWRMGRALQSKGGRGREKIINKWRHSNWSIEIEENEVIVPVNSRKRKATNVLIQSEKKKSKKLECELKESNKKLKEMSNQVVAIQNSAKKIASSLKASPKFETRKRKKLSECSPQYQRKKKNNKMHDVQALISIVNDENFEAKKVELQNKENGSILVVDTSHSSDTSLTNPDKIDATIKRTLYVKERFNVSDVAYHEFSMINSTLPRSSVLKKEAKLMNSKCIVRATPGDIPGVQQSLSERLIKCMEHLVVENSVFMEKMHVRVKITGDGTCISRSLHAVVIAFSIIEECANPNSPGGNHTIALLNCNEKYSELSQALEDICDEIKSLKFITVNGDQFSVEFYLGADLKFLALCMGIEAANAKYSCIWCTCPAEDRYNINKIWSIKHKEHGARTIEDIKKLSIKKGKQKLGCIRQPLFPSIPVDHVIPDILHLFLRISDVLTNLLIQELRRMDGIERSSDCGNHLMKYKNFLNENAKVSFHFYSDKTTKSLKWRDLTGPEKLRQFSKIDIPTLFPNIQEASKIQFIWVELLELYTILRGIKPLTDTDIQSFKIRVKKWLSVFLSIYQTKHVTPYIHILVSHVPEFLEIYGSLSPFSQQGLEKLNDDITKNYFRSTNHRNHEALTQLLFKLNRVEDLQNFGRTKEIHSCSGCKGRGHNIRTCNKLKTTK